MDRQIRVLLVEDNLVSARLEEGMLAHNDSKCFQVQRAETLLLALEILAKERFDIAILDLTLPDCHGLETFLAVQRNAPKVPVIVVTGIDDEAVALNAVRQGAQDYLLKTDLNQERLIRAISYALARSAKQSDARVEQLRTGSVAAFIGVKGGVGTSTLAAHFALEFHAQSAEKVLLADVDVSSSVTSFLLNAESRYTFLDAALNLHRLDTHLWSGLVASTAEGIDLLQAPGAAQISDAPAAERVRHVLRFTRAYYAQAIVDLGRLSAAAFTILEEANQILVVATPDLTALKETSKLLPRILDAGIPSDKVKLILNRRSKPMAISPDQLAKAIGFPIYASFGDYADELADAYSSGRFVDNSLKLRKEVGKVVARWRGSDEEKSESAKFGLFRRRSKSA